MCGVWREYDVTGIGGGEFTLQLILRQKVAPLYWRSDTYLLCLHKDPTNKSKLRPLAIPTANQCLIASHFAHTFRKKFAHHMLPFNYAVGTPNGSNFIINTMQLQVEKYISQP